MTCPSASKYIDSTQTAIEKLLFKLHTFFVIFFFRANTFLFVLQKENKFMLKIFQIYLHIQIYASYFFISCENYLFRDFLLRIPFFSILGLRHLCISSQPKETVGYVGTYPNLATGNTLLPSYFY